MKYLTGCAELFRDGYTDVVSVHAGKGIVPAWPRRSKALP